MTTLPPPPLAAPLAPLPESSELGAIKKQAANADESGVPVGSTDNVISQNSALLGGLEAEGEAAGNEASRTGDTSDLTDLQLASQAEQLLLRRIEKGEKAAIFHLAQLHFEMKNYQKSKEYLEMCDSTDMQALYQLAVIYFDGLGTAADPKKGLALMKEVGMSDQPEYKKLKHSAQYNVGRAYYQGFGVRIDPREAERWWLLAADDGNPDASIQAQTTLGMFYCRPESNEPKKAFFWHSEACGNGSLESQGALGLMYMDGIGIKKSVESAFECLSEASDRGNVYAMGHLIAFYYNNKFHTKCVDLAARVSQLENSTEIAEETQCQENFIRKGICLACFYYGRCLTKGYATKKDPGLAQEYYRKACIMDKPTCLSLQALATQGRV